jgi:hypothetical protein
MDSCDTKTDPKTFKEWMKSSNLWKPTLGVIIGVLSGFLYFQFVGCSSGACAITSNPYSSMIVGGLFGLFVTKSPCSSCK